MKKLTTIMAGTLVLPLLFTGCFTTQKEKENNMTFQEYFEYREKQHQAEEQRKRELEQRKLEQKEVEEFFQGNYAGKRVINVQQNGMQCKKLIQTHQHIVLCPDGMSLVIRPSR